MHLMLVVNISTLPSVINGQLTIDN